MDKVIKMGILVAVIVFGTLGILMVIGVNIPIKAIAVKIGIILGILFAASLVIALITKPTGQPDE